MELILNILYIYIVIYSVYFLMLSIRNLNDKRFSIQERYNNFNHESTFCIIIYSHNNEKTLDNLINQLKSQNYPLQNFSTYVILDNCTDNSEKLFINDNFVQVCSIQNQETIGKDQSISILLEKLSIKNDFEFFVFIDANRNVEKDFLHSINSAMIDSPVVSGSTILVGENLNLRKKIKMAYHKYYTNFLQKSRSLLDLATTVDSDIFIIRRELVEQIGCVDFQNINTELKYSLLLSKIKCKCVFNPNVKTYVNIDDFTLRIPSLSTRFKLFKDCFPQIWTTNFAFNEHALSLLAPNGLLVLASYFYLLPYSFKYYFIADFSVVLLTFLILSIGFSISFLNSKLNSREFGLLCLYPFYSMGHIVKNLPLFRPIKNLINKNSKTNSNSERLTVGVIVTDQKKDIPCKLELISENGLAKVKFIFKNKKFTTAANLRMVDAIKELTTKLADYGFVLKVCQCCRHFTPNVDGSTNMIKGFCSCPLYVKYQNEQLNTLLWNSCKAFEYNKIHSVIEEISQ